MDLFAWLDQSVFRFFGGFARRSEALDWLLVVFVDLDLFKGGVIFSLLWLIWFDLRPGLSERRALLVHTIVGGMLVGALSRASQNFLPHRARPMGGADGFSPPFGIEPKTVEWMREWSSFPSDHAALYFALATGLWLANRCWGTLALAWTLLVICLPRIYVGLHFPSDILAGAALGIVVMLVMARLPRQFTLAKLRFEKTHSPLFYGAAFLLTIEMAYNFDNLRTIGAQALRSARMLLAAA
ncbi:MAG TPA: phosphatase PAP2 family protein [Alphaproteobacteria bacterium]|nr:phosphatase PAP2 family protein [Alphaproteobacteria bacterium]